MTQLFATERIKEQRMKGPKPFTLFKYRYNYNNVLIPSHVLVRSIKANELGVQLHANPYTDGIDMVEIKDIDAESVIKFFGKQSGIKVVEDENV